MKRRGDILFMLRCVVGDHWFLPVTHSLIMAEAAGAREVGCCDTGECRVPERGSRVDMEV